MIKIKYLLLLILCCWVNLAQGQNGHVISGNVYCDAEGPLIMVNVVEVDKNNRIVEATTTDMSGNFSMRIKNPEDRLQISYIGFKQQLIPIGSRTVFKIKMIEDTVLEEVVIKAKPMVSTNGLSIPEREVTGAQQKMSMDEMAGLSFTSVDEAMQGRIAGLDIVANSGDLGSGSSMRLRGVTTINANAEPLIVVNDNIFEMPTGTEDFDYANANEEQYAQLLNVNTEDIEDIQVLKDAATTARYGSKGANGVISIKTRRGARGKTKVSYTYKFTGTWQPDGLNILNGDEYTMLMKEEHYNPTQTALSIPEISYDPTFSEYENYNNNTDWVKAVQQTGQRHNHFLSITGGGEKANFYISGGYDHETGTVIKQALDRFSTRLALDYFVSDRIKFVTNFDLIYTDNQKNYDSGILNDAYNIMPNMSIYTQDARTGRNTDQYYIILQKDEANGGASNVFKDNQKSIVNPVARANQAWKTDKVYSIKPELRIEYNLLGLSDEESRLKYTGAVFMDIFTESVADFYPRTLTTLDWDNGNVNKSSLYDQKSFRVTTTHSLNFTPKFRNEKSFMTMLGTFELSNSTGNNQTSGAYGLPYGSITSPTVEANYNSAGSGSWESRWVAFTYMAHYSWDSKYSIGFTFRRDGSTKFGPERRWGNFPAVSLRWNISDEKFMDFSDKWLSMLAIRPSWGVVGNQPSSDYLHFNKYSKNGTYMDMTAIKPNNIRLTELRWEKTTAYNIGANLGLFEDMITADFNYYNKLTEDLLMKDRGIASSNGFGSLPYKNVGSLRNEGWELYVNSGRFLKIGKFAMSANFNLAQNICTVEKMDASVLASFNGDYNYENGSYLQRIQEGNSVGSIYGFKYKGVYRYGYDNYEKAMEEKAAGNNGTCPVAYDAEGNVIMDSKGEPIHMVFDASGKNYRFQGGDAIYEDINHDGQINELDIVYLGNSNPKIVGGFGFNFYYGRWSLTTLFNFRWGNKILNKARMNLEKMYSHENQSRAVNWRWRKDGDITTIPRALYGTGYNWLGSDRFIEDGSYCRFQYMRLSYSLAPQWLKTYGLSQLSFSASANNLFCWTKYSGVDPEIGYGGLGISEDNAKTPRSKSFTVSMTVGF